MIFITVGTQAPFDRLVELIDTWPDINKYNCFAQIADTNYTPNNFPFTNYLNEQQFEELFNKAQVIISHAGMGTIISCLRSKKLILTLPRLAKYKEHRNNHQVDTTVAFSERGYLYPIFNEQNLIEHLSRLSEITCLKSIGKHADIELIHFIKNEITGL